MELDPDVFLSAAEHLLFSRDTGCCNTIAEVLDCHIDNPYHDFFEMFFPAYCGHYEEQWSYFDDHSDEQHEARILGLLICYWELRFQNPNFNCEGD